MLIQNNPNDDVLVATERTGDADAVALADRAVGLGVFAVDLHFAALARTLGLRARLEQAGDIQPDVEANAVVHSDQDFDLRLRFQRVDEQLRLCVAVLLCEEFLDLSFGFLEWHDARVLPVGDFDDVVAEL